MSKVSHQFHLSGFHKGLSLGVGEESLKEFDRMNLICGVLETIALDGVSDLDTWIYPLVGYVLECVIILSDFQ